MARKRDASAVLAAAAAFLASKNIEAPVVTEEDLDSLNDRDYRSKDAALIFAHYPAGFKAGICAECGAVYMVNRKSVGFCSDPCRRDNWRKTTGLSWSAVSTHDVWDGDPPLIITKEQVAKLAAIAEWFSTNQTVLNTLAETESELAEQEARLSDELGLPTKIDPRAQGVVVGDFSSLFPDLEEDPESTPQTNPHPEPSASGLELTEEEAFLFGFE